MLTRSSLSPSLPPLAPPESELHPSKVLIGCDTDHAFETIVACGLPQAATRMGSHRPACSVFLGQAHDGDPAPGIRSDKDDLPAPVVDRLEVHAALAGTIRARLILWMLGD